MRKKQRAASCGDFGGEAAVVVNACWATRNPGPSIEVTNGVACAERRKSSFASVLFRSGGAWESWQHGRVPAATEIDSSIDTGCDCIRRQPGWLACAEEECIRQTIAADIGSVAILTASASATNLTMRATFVPCAWSGYIRGDLRPMIYVTGFCDCNHSPRRVAGLGAIREVQSCDATTRLRLTCKPYLLCSFSEQLRQINIELSTELPSAVYRFVVEKRRANEQADVLREVVVETAACCTNCVVAGCVING